jgi:uncharacterized protein (DUF1684 family)
VSDAAPATTAGEPTAADRLDLADWRRRVSDLYAQVRVEAARDPERAWEHWRETRENLFRTHPQSPVLAAARATFRVRHWPYAPRYRVEVSLAPERGLGAGASEPAPAEAAAAPPFGGLSLSLPISTGGEQGFARIGRVEVPLPGGSRNLGVYWMAGYAGGLFLPFRDATNGQETYGAGRYLLDTAKSADLGPGAARGSLVLDFNFAFHPSCAFDPKWSCPLAPPENRLDLRIEAGERLS